MPVTESRRTPDEVARLAREILSTRIEPNLGPEDRDKFVVVEVDTGDYEIGTDDYSIISRLKARRPAGELWLGRIGHPAAHRIRRDR